LALLRFFSVSVHSVWLGSVLSLGVFLDDEKRKEDFSVFFFLFALPQPSSNQSIDASFHFSAVIQAGDRIAQVLKSMGEMYPANSYGIAFNKLSQGQTQLGAHRNNLLSKARRLTLAISTPPC
jgi:hypothetical protein